MTLIPFETFEAKESLIESKFRLQGAKETYDLDAYTVRLYPENHRMHQISNGELTYWNHWFTSTKKNRSKQKFPKGFIEITFGENKF